MGKEYTMTRRALSNICTGLGTIGIYLLFKNFWITALMLAAFSYVFVVLFARYKYTVRYKALLVVLVLVLFGLLMFFCSPKKEYNNNNNEPGIVQQEPTDEDKADDDAQDQTDDQTVNVGTTGHSGGKNWTHDSLPDKMEGTFSNVGGVSSNDTGVTKPQSKVEGSTNTKFEDKTQASDDELKAADEAKKNGDKMTDLNEGVIAGTNTKPQPSTEPEKPKDESTRVDPSKEKVEEVTQTQPEQKKEEIPIQDQVQNLDDDALANLDKQTSKEDGSQGGKKEEDNTVTTTKPEENKGEQEKDNQELQEDKNTQTDDNTTSKPEVEESKPSESTPSDTVTEPKEPEKVEPVKTPVTITSLDGDSAYAGDTLQFRTTGDVKSVEGLDGLKYSFVDGVLTVYTNPGEATVISPQVVGADGTSTATTSVTISVINAAS